MTENDNSTDSNNDSPTESNKSHPIEASDESTPEMEPGRPVESNNESQLAMGASTELPSKTVGSKPVEVGSMMRFFFTKRTFALLLLSLMTAGGMLSYMMMVKESNPDIDIPQATVQVACPGRSAELVEKDVTESMERSIKSLRGLKKLRSSSSEGMAIFAIEFAAEENSVEAIQRLRDKISEIEGALPPDVAKPLIIQRTVDDRPVLALTLSGSVNPVLMSRVAKRLRKRLRRVPGVRDVTLSGQRDEQIIIRLIKNRVESYGLSPIQVRDAISTANQDMSWRRFESHELSASFRLAGRFRDIKTLEQTPISVRSDGRIIRLHELAEVRRSLEKERVQTEFSRNGSPFEPGIDIAITRASGTDTVQLIETLREELKDERARSDWPTRLKYTVTTDDSQSIWDELMSVFHNGWQAMLGVFFVLLIMLSWREAIIAALCIPITFLGSLALLWAFGYSLNKLVIIGMILSLGLLVDVFILMMEGMHEGIYSRKESVATAAINTVRTYAPPAFAGQLTTILALAPLMVISGFQGKFIRVIPVTAMTCLLVSFVVALFISIPLSSFLLRDQEDDEDPLLIDRLSEKASHWLHHWVLARVIRRKRQAFGWLTFAALISLSSLYLFAKLPTELYSQADSRDFSLTIEMEPNATLEESAACATVIGEALRSKPYLESCVKFVGQKSPLSQGSVLSSLEAFRAPYLAGFTGRFKDAKQRSLLSYEYLAQLEEEIETLIQEFPGARLRMSFEAGGSVEEPIQIVLFGDEMTELRSLSGDVQRLIKSTAGATGVRDNLGRAAMQIIARPRRDDLAYHKITQNMLGQQISIAMGEQALGSFLLPGSAGNIDINLSMAWASRNGSIGGPTNFSEGQSLSVIKTNGAVLPLSTLTKTDLIAEPMSILHEGGRRAITVLAKSSGATPDEVQGRFLPKLKNAQKKWPSGYQFKVAGAAEDQAETFASAGIMMILSIFLVFALLLLQFGSFGQPFVILLALPISLAGTIIGFYLCSFSFSFPAMIGIIALVGIVVNDSIVMVDTMNRHLSQGMTLKEATARGSSDRLRPILTTTITTLVGLVPLALSTPMWMPLCCAIIFGLIAATLSAFVIIPSSFYLLTNTEKEA